MLRLNMYILYSSYYLSTPCIYIQISIFRITDILCNTANQYIPSVYSQMAYFYLPTLCISFCPCRIYSSYAYIYWHFHCHIFIFTFICYVYSFLLILFNIIWSIYIMSFNYTFKRHIFITNFIKFRSYRLHGVTSELE